MRLSRKSFRTISAGRAAHPALGPGFVGSASRLCALAYAGVGWLSWFYDRVSGFGPASEATYRYSRTPQFLLSSNAFHLRPPRRAAALGRVERSFVRALALIYLCAFASLACGLQGRRGREAFFRPGIFWLKPGTSWACGPTGWRRVCFGSPPAMSSCARFARQARPFHWSCYSAGWSGWRWFVSTFCTCRCQASDKIVLSFNGMRCCSRGFSGHLSRRLKRVIFCSAGCCSGSCFCPERKADESRRFLARPQRHEFSLPDPALADTHRLGRYQLPSRSSQPPRRWCSSSNWRWYS